MTKHTPGRCVHELLTVRGQRRKEETFYLHGQRGRYLMLGGDTGTELTRWFSKVSRTLRDPGWVPGKNTGFKICFKHELNLFGFTLLEKEQR